jgi:predicted HicB family RNase H-like nuclease
MVASVRQNVSVRMAESLHQRLMIEAILRKCSMADLVEIACTDYLNNQENDQKVA